MKKVAACPKCDLLLSKEVLKAKEKASCPRCLSPVGIRHTPLKTLQALSVSCLILSIPAFYTPFLSLEMLGEPGEGWVIEGAKIFLTYNFLSIEFFLIGLIVFACLYAFPLTQFICIFIICRQFQKRVVNQRTAFYIKVIQYTRPWAMLDIWLLAFVITIVKIQDFATITIEIGFFATCALLTLSVVLNALLDVYAFWEKYQTLKSACNQSS